MYVILEARIQQSRDFKENEDEKIEKGTRITIRMKIRIRMINWGYYWKIKIIQQLKDEHEIMRMRKRI